MRHDGRREYAVRLQDISEALIADGYTSLDAQAKALGVHRSTAWTIMKAKHKLGRLSLKTTNSMLANPETPPAVRALVEKYLDELRASPRSRRRSARWGDLFIFDERSKLLRALRATEYEPFATRRTSSRNVVQPHCSAAVGTRRFTNRLFGFE
jgi:hypothetical protein